MKKFAFILVVVISIAFSIAISDIKKEGEENKKYPAIFAGEWQDGDCVFKFRHKGKLEIVSEDVSITGSWQVKKREMISIDTATGIQVIDAFHLHYTIKNSTDESFANGDYHEKVHFMRIIGGSKTSIELRYENINSVMEHGGTRYCKLKYE